MSNLHEHAKEQLEKAGYYTDDYGEMIANSVIDLIDLFSSQGHSGFSANMTIRLFSKLASWEDLDV